MAKRKVQKKTSEKNSCEANGYCCCKWFSVKISAMAFLLLLLVIWDWLRVKLLNLHWGWYLGIMLVFGAIAIGNKECWCHKK